MTSNSDSRQAEPAATENDAVGRPVNGSRFESIQQHGTKVGRDFLAMFERIESPDSFFQAYSEIAREVAILGNGMVPFFRDGLRDPKPLARTVCAVLLLILEKIDPNGISKELKRSVDAVLVDALESASNEHQLLWIAMLAMIGASTPGIVPLLSRKLLDSDMRFRVCAAAILASRASETRDDEQENGRPAASSAELFKTLRSGLTEGEPFAQVVAAAALSQTGIGGKEAVDTLAETAKQAGPPLLYGLVQALGRAKTITKKAIAALIGIRDDETNAPEIRSAATTSLANAAKNETEFLEIFWHAVRARDFGMKIDQAKRLKELERENARLKRAVADLTLDKLILQDVASGKY